MTWKLQTMQVVATSEQQSRGTEATRLPRRSRTRQGKARLLTLDFLDARTAAYAAARRLVETLSTDLGGDEALSEGERQLVTRAAMIGAVVADYEARWVSGEPIPLNEYLAAVNVQRRVLATLGLQRRARDVTLPLRERWAAEFADVAADATDAKPLTIDDAKATEALSDEDGIST